MFTSKPVNINRITRELSRLYNIRSQIAKKDSITSQTVNNNSIITCKEKTTYWQIIKYTIAFAQYVWHTKSPANKKQSTGQIQVWKYLRFLHAAVLWDSTLYNIHKKLQIMLGMYKAQQKLYSLRMIVSET